MICRHSLQGTRTVGVAGVFSGQNLCRPGRDAKTVHIFTSTEKDARQQSFLQICLSSDMPPCSRAVNNLISATMPQFSKPRAPTRPFPSFLVRRHGQALFHGSVLVQELRTETARFDYHSFACKESKHDGIVQKWLSSHTRMSKTLIH